VHFLLADFEQISVSKMAATEAACKTAKIRVLLPFCIRILQEHKEKD